MQRWFRLFNGSKRAVQNQVHRISVKGGSGSKHLDWAFAYGNLPYYWGSDGFHQQWYGSDCAKLVSVAYKSAGKDIGYVGTASLINRSKKVQFSSINKQGKILSNGKTIEYGSDIEVGDAIVTRNSRWGHAGLIGEDANGNGVLDVNDYVLHTSRTAPKYEALKNTCFANGSLIKRQPVKILK